MNKNLFINFARKLLVKLNPYSPYPISFDFRMTKDEILLFDKVVAKSKHYLEFGLGGSTIRVLQKSNAKVETVETSKEWIRKIIKYWYIRKNLNTRLTIHFVDIGPTQGWGYPINESNKEQFPVFSKLIFEKINPKTIDTVLIDGRFRVASTLMTIMQCHTNTNFIILIHDFWNRPHYHEVLNFLTVESQSGTLGVFKIKENIDLELCEKRYEEFKYNPR